MIRQSKISHRGMHDGRQVFVMNMANMRKQVMLYLKIETSCEPGEQAIIETCA